MMQESSNLLLLGAGGHCLSVLDSVLGLNQYKKIGIINKNIGGELLGIPVVGTDEDLPNLFMSGYTNAFITVGSIGDVSIREKLYILLKKIGFQIPNIIDKTSIVSNHIKLGEGNFIGKNAVINAKVTIGNCIIINTSSTIEHECHIGNYVHVSPGSTLCGNVYIDRNAHIGAGSVIKQGIHIGANTMIGMGSIVTHDIPSNVKAFGNPCKEVKYE